MIKIAPSILSADFSNLERDIALVEKGGADLLHIDVMDGFFVPNITIGPPVIKSIRMKSALEFDVHLMIENPERYIKDFAKSGADIITVHAEATKHLNRTVQLIRSEGKKAGVSINPATSISVLEEIIFDIDLVLIMSVNPGFGGQKFLPSTLNRISKLKTIINNNNLNVVIEVDGGIGIDNVESVWRSGADIVVAGSAIYNSDDIGQTISKMKERCV